MKKSGRQIAREKATIGVYQHLLVDSSLENIKSFLADDKTLMGRKDLLEFSIWLVDTVLQNKDTYQNEIEKYLKKEWSFDRLSVMERAILLIATCELLESDVPKNIIINEAVINAKEFCDEDSYKFINGVLSKVI
jgi:transcription antitermination factor NusB